MPTVLVIDNELGFMFALALELRKRGLDLIPSRSVTEAGVLLDAIQPELRALIVNCECRGAAGFARRLRNRDITLPVITLDPGRRRSSPLDGLTTVTLRDPEDREPERIQYCADVVQDVVFGGRRGVRRETAPAVTAAAALGMALGVKPQFN